MKINWLLALLPAASWAAEVGSKDVGYNWRCNLYCYNKGECRHGKSKFGSYAGVEETAELPWESEGHAGVGMYCACPVGFTGLQCEIAMKVCGDDENTCFNGSACAKETDMDGKLWWRCECDAENSVLSASYAGKYCEHLATTFCNNKKANTLDPGSSYCTNGGQCKERDHAGQQHAGCICEPGFEGAHCEVNTITKQNTMGHYAAQATNSKMIGLIIGLIVMLVLAGTAYLYFRDRKERKRARRKKRLRNAGIETPDSFRGTSTGELA